MSLLASIVALGFWLLLLSAGALIALSGNRPAQQFLTTVILATVVTAMAAAFLPSADAAYAYFVIDGALLGVALYFVLTLDRYWPIWFAGFHSVAVASELSRFAFPVPVPEMYANLAGFWSVPALLATALGVSRDRLKLSRHFHENDSRQV